MTVSTNIAFYANILQRLSQPRLECRSLYYIVFSPVANKNLSMPAYIRAADSGIRWSVCGRVLEGEWRQQRSAGNNQKHRHTPGAQTFITGRYSGSWNGNKYYSWHMILGRSNDQHRMKVAEKSRSGNDTSYHYMNVIYDSLCKCHNHGTIIIS